jgi:hypothetical protein
MMHDLPFNRRPAVAKGFGGASPHRQRKTFSSAHVGRGKEICPPAGEKTNLLILSLGYRKTERPHFLFSLLAKVSPHPVSPMESIIGILFGRASLPAIASLLSQARRAGRSAKLSAFVCG